MRVSNGVVFLAGLGYFLFHRFRDEFKFLSMQDWKVFLFFYFYLFKIRIFHTRWEFLAVQ